MKFSKMSPPQAARNFAATLGLCVTLFIAPFAVADTELRAAQFFVGAWIVNGQADGAPPFINVVTNHRDRTMVNSDPIFGTGHGVWARTGVRNYTVKFVTITSPFNPVFPNAIITVNGELELEGGADSASGTFVTTFTGLDGSPLIPPSTGTIGLTRIELD